MKPKKSLGQNFLNSQGAIGKIVKAGNIQSDETVLEIGPGKGALTKALLESGATVIAVEKDESLLPILKEKFWEEIAEKRLTLVQGDVLDSDPESLGLKAGQYKLIANIPYYITGEIIRKFLTSTSKPSLMVLLVQKEVAERIVAKDGKESLLSLSVKVYGTPTYIGTVKSGSFFPVPNVDSAILKIEVEPANSTSRTLTGEKEKAFFEILHAGFAHKRKKLKGNLVEYLCRNAGQNGGEEVVKSKINKVFADLSLDENVRAEDLKLETWKNIAQML